MFFSSNPVKLCHTCKLVKECSDFHRDSKNKDGFSSSCGPCRNARRKALKEKGSQSVSKAPLVSKVKIVPEEKKNTAEANTASPRTLEDTLRQISEKYDSHFVISIAKDGKKLLHVQSNPARVYRGNSIEQVLQDAMLLA